MSTDLTLEQQIFLLNVASNLVSGRTGSVESLANQAKQRIEKEMKDHHLDSWRLVWGPSVWQAKNSLIADHVIFAALKDGEGQGEAKQQPHLVISIAGSNGSPLTSYNWRVNNMKVGKQIQWTGVPGAKISEGTWIGLKNLKGLSPGVGLPGEGQTIERFAQSQAVEMEMDITVTGFSLGGALSPVMALWLHDIQSQWDPQQNATMHCRPAAGAAIGNQEFARYFNSQLGKMTTRLSNDLDIVPHVWKISDMKGIHRLYDLEWAAREGVRLMVKPLRRRVEKGNYTHVDTKKTFNRGPLTEEQCSKQIGGHDYWADAIDEAMLAAILEEADYDAVNGNHGIKWFFTQAGMQHTCAYALEMGVKHNLSQDMAGALQSAGGASEENLASIAGVMLKALSSTAQTDDEI